MLESVKTLQNMQNIFLNVSIQIENRPSTVLDRSSILRQNKYLNLKFSENAAFFYRQITIKKSGNEAVS